MGDQWYKLLDAGRNATSNFVTSVQKIEEYEKKTHPKKDEKDNPVDGATEVKPKETTRKAKMRRIIHYVEKPVDYCLSTLSFIVLIIATTLLLWQLYGKIKSYVNNPVQVSTEYSYPSSVSFPGIVLCNTKPLQISYVGPSPMMSIINYYNFNDSTTLNDYNQYKANASSLNMTAFYLNASQQKDDFFLQCTWPDGTKCSADNDVESVITDYGVCYRFKLDNLPNVSYSGSTSGLTVMLNIATYENIKGPEATVGAKLALYDRSDTPLVTQVGFDSPPGFQTSVGLKYQKTVRLPKSNKGQCDPKAKLDLYSKYSYAGCRMEKKFKQIMNNCSCKPYNMPDETGAMAAVPLCNADQQLGCVVRTMSAPVQLAPDDCPEACQSLGYSMMLSYSQISVDRVKDLLTTEQKTNMSNDYIKALGTRSSFEAQTKLAFDQKVNDLLAAYKLIYGDKLEPVMGSSFQELSNRLSTSLSCYVNEFSWKQTSKISTADLLAAKQPITLKNAFVSAQQMAQSLDATFNYTFQLFPVLDQYQTARDTVFKQSYNLSNNPALQNDSAFMSQYESAKQSSAQFLTQIQGSMSSYSSVFGQYLNNLDTVSTNVSSFSQSDLFVLNASSYLALTQNTVNTSKMCLTPLAVDIQSAVTMVGNASFDVSSLKTLLSSNEQKISGCSSKLQTVVVVLNDYSNNYSTVLLEYQNLLTKLDSYKTDQLQFYSKVLSEQVLTFDDSDYKIIQSECMDYISQSKDRATLASDLVTNYNQYWLTLQDHFTRIRTQLLNSRISLDNFVARIGTLKDSSDPNLLSLVSKEFLGFSNATDATAQCVAQVQKFIVDFTVLLQNHSNLWRQAYDNLITDCTAYQASFTIDDSFYSANIVTFNIYFQDLAITKISQFLTYSEVGMISDVAGTIGIILGFIGTTGLTLFTTLKAMTKKVSEQVKKRMKPKSKDGSRPMEEPAKPAETVVVVVEEFIVSDHSQTPDIHDMEVENRVDTPDTTDKSELHQQETKALEERLKTQLRRNNALPKLE